MEKFEKCFVEKGIIRVVTVIMLVFAKKPREKERMNYYTYSTGKRGDCCFVSSARWVRCVVEEQTGLFIAVV